MSAVMVVLLHELDFGLFDFCAALQLQDCLKFVRLWKLCRGFEEAPELLKLERLLATTIADGLQRYIGGRQRGGVVAMLVIEIEAEAGRNILLKKR